MSRHGPRRAERSAGAILGPDILVPTPLRTLSDDYHDVPTYPEDEREPEPERPGRVRRLLDRLAGHTESGR
jgi:hypothetical protein